MKEKLLIPVITTLKKYVHIHPQVATGNGVYDRESSLRLITQEPKARHLIARSLGWEKCRDYSFSLNKETPFIYRLRIT